MNYVMESADETRRLVAQAEAEDSRALLERCGLRPGMRALDVGCGPGVIARRIAEVVGDAGSVVGLDVSPERIAAATAHNGDLRHVQFVCADVYSPGLPAASFDFVWSQFLFEYLAEPARALAGLVRLVRPGGKIVISDIDGVGTLGWPMSPSLEAGFRRLVDAVAATGFDLHVGRKLYALFRDAGVSDVKVHLQPLYLVAGAAPERLIRDWQVRFDALAPTAARAFGGPAPYAAFVTDYLAHLADDRALKYGITLVTEGTCR